MKKIKVNDNVLITTGKDKGKRGKVQKVLPKKGKLLIFYAFVSFCPVHAIKFNEITIYNTSKKQIFRFQSGKTRETNQNCFLTKCHLSRFIVFNFVYINSINRAFTLKLCKIN